MILSNVKLDHGEIVVRTPTGVVPTGLKKFRSDHWRPRGDQVQLVLNPGSLIGRNTVLYPGTLWKGVAPEDSVIKTKQTHEITPRKA